MEFETVIGEAKDALTIKRVFGEPYEKNGVTIIPTAHVQGGAGAGAGEGTSPSKEDGTPMTGSGQGGGFGMNAKATGVFVVKGDEVRFQPAIDVNKIIIGAQIVAVVALLAMRAIVKARHRD
jgi:uncharacterized spore protein YtfJ